MKKLITILILFVWSVYVWGLPIYDPFRNAGSIQMDAFGGIAPSDTDDLTGFIVNPALAASRVKTVFAFGGVRDYEMDSSTDYWQPLGISRKSVWFLYSTAIFRTMVFSAGLAAMWNDYGTMDMRDTSGMLISQNGSAGGDSKVLPCIAIGGSIYENLSFSVGFSSAFISKDMVLTKKISIIAMRELN